jgi:hypothetical protein
MKLQQEASEKTFQLESAVTDHRLQLQEKNKFIQETMTTLEVLVSVYKKYLTYKALE